MSDCVKAAAAFGVCSSAPAGGRLDIGKAEEEEVNSWLDPGRETVGNAGSEAGMTPIMGVPAGGEGGGWW